jgi:hypothetical protein
LELQSPASLNEPKALVASGVSNMDITNTIAVKRIGKQLEGNIGKYVLEGQA